MKKLMYYDVFICIKMYFDVLDVFIGIEVTGPEA